MPPEVWQRVKRVVYKALELEPEEWPRFLQESCHDDIEVLSEAKSLLEVSWSIGNFIEVPVTEYLQRELAEHRARCAPVARPAPSVECAVKRFSG